MFVEKPLYNTNVKHNLVLHNAEHPLQIRDMLILDTSMQRKVFDWWTQSQSNLEF